MRKVLSALFMLLVGSTAARAATADNWLAGMEWRQLGPFRSGWSTMAVGVADEIDTYYAGYAGGGVWKTTDAGQTWAPIFDHVPAASVGALAVAPSNPRVIYVGTGQPEQRYDIASGNGVYRSDDGGSSWRSVGLTNTRHIGAIAVDPRDANVVWVAALGHLFGRNEERGVFRSADGGKTWSRSLFVAADTGAVDLALDPADPEHLYASTWTARHWPWLSYFTPLMGPGSGIYESHDNGRSFTPVTGVGLPAGPLGRIGLAVARVGKGVRLYASVIAKAGGGLFRSDDGGARFEKVNDAPAVVNPYFSRLTVDPNNADILYLIGQSIHKSVDGGKTFTIIRGSPGGDDYHSLWINPHHPERMIAASDQGTVITVNGAATWSSWYNSPTGQLYYLAADNQFPYRIYSGQQDSGTVSIASRSDYGAIGFRDWTPVGADERDYDIPDPDDPDIVYGSGLGGRLSRWDRRTGEVQNITPVPVNSYGRRPTDFTQQFTWFTPIAIGVAAPHPLYFATQTLFRSLDRGIHWEAISPRLSHRDPANKSCEGDLDLAAAQACGYGVIYSIAPSPRDNDEIWIGTDDGRVMLTKDAGRRWQDVTPAGLALWSKISRVELSARTPGLAYLAIDNHRIDDIAPHVLRTRDYGKTWTDISVGLPVDHFVSVVRADPVREGLLYAGTDIGVQVSFDDGAHWQALQLNLPPAWVHDLLIHGNDLIAATQGRAIWLLDDVSRLRQLAAGDGIDATRLFTPANAIRMRSNQNKDTPMPAETPLGTNPPDGAIIDYVLGSNSKGPVSLDIRDSTGKIVRQFSSADPAESLAVERQYFADAWTARPRPLSATPGAHRFVWDLRLPRPRSPVYSYSISTSLRQGTPIEPRGPLVVPGDYRITLRAGGQTFEAPLRVTMDPRSSASDKELRETLEFCLHVGNILNDLWRTGSEIDALREMIDERATKLGSDSALSAELQAAKTTTTPWVEGEDEATYNVHAIGELLAGLLTDVQGTDRPPTPAQRELVAARQNLTQKIVAEWRAWRAQELPKLNARLRKARLSPIVIPAAESMSIREAEGGEEMP